MSFAGGAAIAEFAILLLLIHNIVVVHQIED
jgi:hypothetical protein